MLLHLIPQLLNFDGLAKGLQSRHSRMRESGSAAAGLISLDSRVRGNDNNGGFLAFYEFINSI